MIVSFVRKKLMNWRYFRPWLLSVGLVLILGSCPLWLPFVRLVLIVQDPLTPADALVPLVGGDDRMREAVRLYHEGYAQRIVVADLGFVSPTGQFVSRRNAYLAMVEDNVPSHHLYLLDRLAHSTYTELEAVRDLAQREGWQSLMLVTSPQHTRRTRMIADRVFAHSGITVAVQPVQLEGVDPARWWVDPDERRMTLMEYAKIVAFWLGYRGR